MTLSVALPTELAGLLSHGFALNPLTTKYIHCNVSEGTRFSLGTGNLRHSHVTVISRAFILANLTRCYVKHLSLTNFSDEQDDKRNLQAFSNGFPNLKSLPSRPAKLPLLTDLLFDKIDHLIISRDDIEAWELNKNHVLTCRVIKGVVKHVSRQHKQTNHDVCCSKVHQKIVHGSPHLLTAINNQAN